MTTTTDHRQAALSRANDLIGLLRSLGQPEIHQPLVDECEALARAIAAFHMEGIRFRMFNVDRRLTQDATLPGEARPLFLSMRSELEAAGFHTRSHQAPG